VLFILLAGLGALVVFFMVARYVGSVNSQVAPLVTVYKAAKNIPAYRELGPQNVVAVEMPERYVPPQALREGTELAGQRVGFNVAEGTLIGADMLLPPSDLNANEREIAIEVDAVTGIAGRVASGDFVDIYAVFADAEGGGGNSQVLVQNVRVVSVGGRMTRSKETGEGALREADVLPVTVALEPDDALKVTYADSFATAVRLVGLPPGIQTENRTGEMDSVDSKSLGLPKRRLS
jgi:pilus assembly protein CpaB